MRLEEQMKSGLLYREYGHKDPVDQEYEKIIEKQENGMIVEGEYQNDFVAVQRMLSFGSNSQRIIRFCRKRYLS